MPLGTRLRFSLPVPALRRCRWSARAFPRPCLELALDLRLPPVPQARTGNFSSSCRFSSRRRALLLCIRLAASASFLGPSVSSSACSRERTADFALRLSLRSGLVSLASSQPSCRLPFRRSPQRSRPASPAIPSGQPSSLSTFSSAPCSLRRTLRTMASQSAPASPSCWCTACAFRQLSGPSVQERSLRLSPSSPIPPVPSVTALEAEACASASRTALPDSPSGSRLLRSACAAHIRNVHPACLR